METELIMSRDIAGKEMDAEHEAWMDMCEKMEQVFNISQEEFNRRKDIRELCIAIEKWGYAEHMRRNALGDDEKRGVFFKI